MKDGMARKLTRTATVALLAFATTSGAAGIAVLAASPAMAQPNDPGRPFAPAHEQQTAGPADGLTGIIGGLTGGGGSNPGSNPGANPGSGTPTSPGNSGGGGLGR